MKNIEELLSKYHIKIKNRFYYRLALTHPSYNIDANTVDEDYQKLEYIGDAVLDFVSADMIFRMHPELDEGTMSKLRSYLVRSESLAEFASQINLADLIVVGKSFPRENIKNSKKILEDVFESLVGAIYMDNNIDVAYKFIDTFLHDKVKTIDLISLTDPKSALQEMMQAETRDSVHYETIEISGPAHDRHFKVNVLFNDIVLASGEGHSKKAAEEDAASKALAKRSI